MSGPNTKASKVERALRRVAELPDQYEAIERLSNSLKLATETAHRLEAENAKLRRYLGSELFKRRQREMQIPTLEPKWGNSGDGCMRCACAIGTCEGYTYCRHRNIKVPV